MPSDKTTVATTADFAPMVVGKTDRDRSFSGVLAHDERSPQPRPEVHPEALNVLIQQNENGPLRVKIQMSRFWRPF